MDRSDYIGTLKKKNKKNKERCYGGGLYLLLYFFFFKSIEKCERNYAGVLKDVKKKKD